MNHIPEHARFLNRKGWGYKALDAHFLYNNNSNNNNNNNNRINRIKVQICVDGTF